jgi:hypothetical protein
VVFPWLQIASVLCFVLYGMQTAQNFPAAVAMQNLYVAIVLIVVVCLTCYLSYVQEGQAAKAMDAFKVGNEKPLPALLFKKVAPS